jgi:hypothetical protein
VAPVLNMSGKAILRRSRYPPRSLQRRVSRFFFIILQSTVCSAVVAIVLAAPGPPVCAPGWRARLAPAAIGRGNGAQWHAWPTHPASVGGIASAGALPYAIVYANISHQSTN